MLLNANIRCVRLITSLAIIVMISYFTVMYYLDYFLIGWVGLEFLMTCFLWGISKSDDGENFTLQDED